MSAPLSGELSAQPTEGFHSCFLIDEAPCIPLRLNNYDFFIYGLYSRHGILGMEISFQGWLTASSMASRKRASSKASGSG